MPTLRERFDIWRGGRLLEEQQQQIDQLIGMNQRLAQAYQAGVYELPPDELLRQLQEYYDPQLVADLVDRMNWEVVSGYGGYSEDERVRAVQDSQRMFKYSILARWIVNLWTYYGIGSNVSIVAEDEAADEYWQAFWTADRNQQVIAKDRMDELSRWLLVTGERFHAFFSSTIDGETTVRNIVPGQISNVLTNPDDATDFWFYERTWVQAGQQRVLYYPDWELFFAEGNAIDKAWREAAKAYTLNGELAQQTGTAACVLFTPFIQLDEESPRGWPLLAPHGTSWLRAQREFMQDRATVTKAKAAFVRRYAVSGGSRAVDSVRRTLASAFQFGGTSETNPPPVAGSSEVHNRAMDVTDLPMSTGAGDAKSDGEMFAWMAGLAGGVFPHYLGLGDAYRLATACYSDDTEVLTETGWKGWREVNGDKIATYNHSARQIEYMKPTKLHVYDYNGEMCAINGRGINALVTPNHRMLALNENNMSKPWAKTEYEVMRADSLPSRFAFPTQATVNSRRRDENFILESVGEGLERSRLGTRMIPMDRWLRFLGWWISEGWLEGHPDNYIVGISQAVDSPDVPSISSVLKRVPFAFSRSLDAHGCYRWRCNDKALYKWLEENCGSGAGEKKLPEMAFYLHAEQARILLDALWDGDGHWEMNQPHYRGFFTTISRELADGVQALILNVGEWGSLGVNREARAHPLFPDAPTCWVVHRNVQDKRSLARRLNVETVPYNGKVWCFEAPPNKMFITRREGCPLIAGNTAMETPIQQQFSLYRNQLGAMMRRMVRIVLQFQEKYGGTTFESYAADVSTDRLVEADLSLTSDAVSKVYRDVVGTLGTLGISLPPGALDRMTVFTLQKVLEAMGAQDVQEIISVDDYEQQVEPPMSAELTESHEAQRVSAICPLCAFNESVSYPDHGGLLVCAGCGKTWDPSVEGRTA